VSRAAGRGRAGFTIALAVLAFVLASDALRWETICYGEDGHVAFESSRAGRCGGFERGAAGAELADVSGLAAVDRCCGPCTDVLAAFAQWAGRSASARDAAPPAHAIACPAARAVAPLPSTSLAFACAAAPLDRRPASTSVVLRC